MNRAIERIRVGEARWQYLGVDALPFDVWQSNMREVMKWRLTVERTKDTDRSKFWPHRFRQDRSGTYERYFWREADAKKFARDARSAGWKASLFRIRG